MAVVYEVGEADGRVYIAMELVEGENLRARLERGRLDSATARDIALQITRGLAAAHEKGIVHRDLKPENVMVTPAAQVKLLDFGLAKAGADRSALEKTDDAFAKTEMVVTSDGRVIGTPAYMSPEQALGEPLDVRSDVFSLGIVLYELFSGTRPFAGASTGAVLVAITRDAASPLRERAPEIDAPTEAVVMRCLAKTPEDRFASAAEVVTALSTAGSAPSRIDTAPVPRVATAAPRPRIALATTLLAAVAVAAGVGWWSIGHLTKTPARAGASNAASSPSKAAATAPSSTSAPHKGVAITDHPPPKTNVPEAAAAYAAALQARRGGSWAVAEDEMEKATTLDPTLAAAQLRASLYEPGSAPIYAGRDTRHPISRRQHLAAAERLAGALDERDQMLLKVAEARVIEPVDHAAAIARLRAVVQRFPDDAEASLLLGEELPGEEGRNECLRTLDLDPAYASALLELGWSDWGRMDDGPADLVEARAFYYHCLDAYPSAATCLQLRALADLYEGECASLDADAKKAIEIDAQARYPYEYLAMALASEKASQEAIEDALRKDASTAASADARTAMAAERSLAMALVVGDLVAAEASARQGVALVEGAQSEAAHDAPMEVLLDVLEERGDDDRALAEAEAFGRKAAAWTRDAPWGVESRLALMRNARGRIDGSKLASTLDALEQQGLDSAGWGSDASGRAWWGLLVGRRVLTSEQANEVLAKLDHTGPLPSHPLAAPSMGRLFLLADHAADAVAPLRVAARSCTMLTTRDAGDTIGWMRTHVLLGQALEQTDNTAGACAAYAVVLDLWKNATPRSVTLETARERTRLLRCRKP